MIMDQKFNYIMTDKRLTLIREFLQANCISANTYTIDKYGLVDVDGDVHINPKTLNMLKSKPIHYGCVSGDFICHTKWFQTFEWFPQQVGGKIVIYVDCEDILVTNALYYILYRYYLNNDISVSFRGLFTNALESFGEYSRARKRSETINELLA